MVYNVFLEKGDRGYVATVQGLPGVEGHGSTREETLAEVREALDRRLSAIEVVPVIVDEPDPAAGYPVATRQLALETARRPGEDPSRLAGNPWVDLSGYLSDVPDEYWEAYEAALRAIREEDAVAEETP